MKAYAEDLARIHDEGYGGFARKAGPGVLALLRDAGIEEGLVVDLGCGSGIWAEELIREGYGVVGYDISKAMVAMCRKRVPKGTFHARSFLDADLPRCAAVTSMGECLGYLFEKGSGLRALERLFRRVFAALEPGGLFVFDVATPARAKAMTPLHGQAKDWALLADFEYDERRRIFERHITTFMRSGRTYRRDHEVHRVQLYEGPELAAKLRKVGFRVRVVRRYGEMQFPDALVGLVARKP